MNSAVARSAGVYAAGALVCLLSACSKTADIPCPSCGPG